MNKPVFQFSRAKASAGYGIVMLITFIATTVLIGASMQMMVGPVTMAYLGSSSQDNLTANQIANQGMEVVMADLQSKFNTLQTVSTSYTYPTTNVTMPSDPSSLAVSDSTIGSYSATLTKARGNALLVKVTAICNSSTVEISKLVPMGKVGLSLDAISGSTAAYSLRQLNTSVTNTKAIRVRRSSDDTEQDIGFLSNGELDVPALQTFLGIPTLPLDSVTSATAAYSLRQLRAAYSGSAIRVRRSSDNTEQDIGFTPGGDLDCAALLDFVGTGNGYVKTWYDQSGNSRDATQTAQANQPRIVSSGIIYTQNGRPALYFDFIYYLSTTSFTGFASAYQVQAVAGVTGTWGNIIAKTTAGSIAAPFDFYGLNAHITGDGSVSSFYIPTTSFDSNQAYGLWGYNGSATNANSWYNGQSTGMQVGALSYGDTGQPLVIGSRGGGVTFMVGYMGEILLYNTQLSNANRQKLEQDQARYYRLKPSTAALTSGTPVRAYGLRKLRTNYGGWAIYVRRSSDNAYANIGFTSSGDLDTATLLSFAGGSSVYVYGMYDQGGSSSWIAQGINANQPRIVNAGVLETTSGGRPAMRFLSASSTYLASNSSDLPTGAAPRTVNAVYSFNDAVTDSAILGWGAPTNGNQSILYRFSASDPYVSGWTQDIGSGYAYDTALKTSTFTYDGTTLATFKNAVAGASAAAAWNTTSSNLYMGKATGSYDYMDGLLSEAYVFNTALNTRDRAALENNQISYYGIGTTAVAQSPPLDALRGATVAYSLRKLTPAYTGNAIQVRRSSDSTTQNIGFTFAGDLDVTSLMTFVGTGSGYITTWYDQSGNSKNLLQATAASQPRIVNAGVLEMQSGKPSVHFTTLTKMALASDITGIGDYTAFGVSKNVTSGDDLTVLAANTANRQILRFFGNKIWNNSEGNNPGDNYTSASFDLNSALGLISIVRSGATSTAYYNGGVSNAMSPGGTSSNVQFGCIHGGDGWAPSSAADSYISEAILYSVALPSMARQAIEQSIQQYYSPPASDGYIVKWYDQSGNGNDAVQYNPSQQPTITFDQRFGKPTVGFNGKQLLISTTGMPTNSDYSKSAVFSYSDVTAENNLIAGAGNHAFNLNRTNYLKLFHSGYFLTTSVAMTTDIPYAVLATYNNGSSTGTVYQGNAASVSTTSSTPVTVPSIYLGSYASFYFLKGTMSEAIIFNKMLSTTERTALYTDQQTFFGAK